MRAFASLLALVAALFALGGCAAAFRSSKAPVRFETDPAGAEVRVNREAARGPTPVEAEIARSGTTQIAIVKAGHEDHRGIVKKSLNPGWLTVDIITCVFPVALCIPLLVDAVTGAWHDLPSDYSAKLEPARGVPPGAVASGSPTVASPNPGLGTSPVSQAGSVAGAPAIPITNPPPSMSESERKSSARAAFQEGVALLEKSPQEALAKFQTAQKLFDAPTHIFRIGQCLALTGKLVEAQEVYEVLTRRDIPATSPDAFKEAQSEGKKELDKVRARIPTLRVQVSPAPPAVQNVVVQMNGATMPNELLGIARPVNPGVYRITATAKDMKTQPVDVKLEESTQKDITLKFSKF